MIVLFVLHVVVFQLLPDVGPEAVQDETGTLVVTALAQVVATQLLAAAAVTGVQVDTAVGPETTGAGQVVAT